MIRFMTLLFVDAVYVFSDSLLRSQMHWNAASQYTGQSRCPYTVSNSL